MSLQKKPVTLKTLAKILGLTPSTISKALRDCSDISEKTRILVKQKAEELGYQPNVMARTLISRQSNILGIIVPDLGHSFFAEVTRGIYEQARIHGYESIIMVHDENSLIEGRNLGFLAALNVDGILIASVPGTENNDLINQIHNRGIPIVCFDRIIDGLTFNSITIDDEKASYSLTECMIQAGRQNIIFFGPTKDLFVAKGRYQGYRKALADHGIEYLPELVLQSQINIEEANLKMKQFIESGIKFDATLCVSGIIAYGVGRAILQAGLTIPGDVMLGEFGDNNIVHQLGVPFVTIDQFPYKMGKKAAEMIVDIIKNKDKELPMDHVFIDTRLIHHHHNGFHYINNIANEKI